MEEKKDPKKDEEKKEPEEKKKAEKDREKPAAEKKPIFLQVYWRAIVLFLTPIFLLPIFLMGTFYRCLYTILVMFIYWSTEGIPIPATSLIPLFAFPFFGCLGSMQCLGTYMREATAFFAAGLLISLGIEFSQIHKRISYCFIRTFGYTHRKMTFSLCTSTMLLSMVVTNAGATALMLPIAVALLQSVEASGQGDMQVTRKDKKGNEVTVPSDMTECYFLGIAFSAAVGGIATFIGTGTTMLFVGVFQEIYNNTDYLSFKHYMMYGIPQMVVMEILVILWLLILYLGLVSKSPSSQLSTEGQAAVKATFEKMSKELSRITWHEIGIILWLLLAIYLFCWIRVTAFTFQDMNETNILDSAYAIVVVVAMFMIPARCEWMRFFSKKDGKELPNKPGPGFLTWKLAHNRMPWGLLLLMGSGIGMAAVYKNTELSDWTTKKLRFFKDLSLNAAAFILILVAVILTNMCANMCVASLMLPPVAFMANAYGMNCFFLMLPTAIACSWAFMLPTGTPHNAIASGVGRIPRLRMVRAGIVPAIISVIVTWLFVAYFSSLIWPDIREYKEWQGGKWTSDDVGNRSKYWDMNEEFEDRFGFNEDYDGRRYSPGVRPNDGSVKRTTKDSLNLFRYQP